MALPAPVQQPGLVAEHRGPVELGTIGVSLATQPQAWPLSVVSNLLDAYRMREQGLPDLDVAVASRIVESHCTPDLHDQKLYTPFKISQSSLPGPLLNISSSSHKVKAGYLASLDTLWLGGRTTFFWNLVTSEVKEFGFQGSEPILDITETAPNAKVFSDEVRQLLAISTAKEMRLYAVDNNGEIFDSQLAIALDGLGQPRVRGTASGRIFFSCENTGTSLWEFRYNSKETWFSPKVQRVCHGEYGGLFGGLFGAKAKPNTERILDFVVDDSVSVLYALTTKSAIHVYEFGETSHSISLARSISSSQVRASLFHSLGKTTEITLVGLSAVPLSQSNFIRLVAVTSGGDRIYFRANDPRRAASQLQSAYVQRLPTSQTTESNNVQGQQASQNGASQNGASQNGASQNGASQNVASQNGASQSGAHQNGASQSGTYQKGSVMEDGVNSGQEKKDTSNSASKSASQKELNVSQAIVIDGRVTFAVTPGKVLASTIDHARIAHQSDQRQPISFVELSGWLAVDGPVIALIQSSASVLVLTNSSLYRVRRRAFCERFQYPDASYALVRVYGLMQLCCGALQLASQTSSRATRENAISAYFRFGGLPVLRTSPVPGFLGHSTIKLSPSFDGLALFVAKLLLPLWSKKILGPNDELPESHLLDKVYAELSGLVNLLEQNRSFSEGMSERTSSYSHGDDNALLSQAEYKGLQGLNSLAKSSQEGIAFLKLVLTQNDSHHLFSYFDTTRMNHLRQLTYGEFFTAARNSDVARELVNSLINHVLNKGDSVDAITSVIQDRCSSYCSTGDVLEYKALEFIHHAKQNTKHIDAASLARSVTLIRKAAASIQLETLRDVVRDYAQLKYFVGAVQASLAVAAEQDPANLAVGYLRHRTSKQAQNPRGESPAKKRSLENNGAIPIDSSNALIKPISESELKFTAKTVVYNILFTEVLDEHPELALASSKDPAHAVMLSSTDEVWHFALYDWYLANNQQDQIALLDTQFVATYLQLGAPKDLRIANLLWKWHQRHGDLLAAADVLLDLARGPLVPELSQRVEFLSRAMGYCQAQPQNTQQTLNMTTMVRAYLGLALLQTDVLNQLAVTADDEIKKQLNNHLFTVSELYNDWAEPNGLYEICFAIFEFSDLHDPVLIKQCWSNLLMKTRIEDSREGSTHYAHVAAIVARLGAKYSSYEPVFSASDMVPLLEKYAVDYTPNAPAGWIVDALLGAGISSDVLYRVYSDTLKSQLLEGEYVKHAQKSIEYLKSCNQIA